jgi:cytochrome oxidase Cu insertion factor (SCO1/SenC/PrrC family)
MNAAALLAPLGALLVFGNFMFWWRALQEVRVPPQPQAVAFSLAIGGILCIAGLVARPGWLTGLLAVLTLPPVALFLFLDRIASMPEKAPAVRVGEVALDFEAPASDGTTFALRSLRGRPVLLKFFRGFW